jgi:hypothetical protein
MVSAPVGDKLQAGEIGTLIAAADEQEVQERRGRGQELDAIALDQRADVVGISVHRQHHQAAVCKAAE